jgi:hypothetical protein
MIPPVENHQNHAQKPATGDREAYLDFVPPKTYGNYV